MTPTSRQLFEVVQRFVHAHTDAITHAYLHSEINTFKYMPSGVIMPAMPHGKWLWASMRKRFASGSKEYAVDLWKYKPTGKQFDDSMDFAWFPYAANPHAKRIDTISLGGAALLLSAKTVNKIEWRQRIEEQPTQVRLHAETKPPKKKR